MASQLHSTCSCSDIIIYSRRFNKSAVVGGESVAQENFSDGAGEVRFGQEKDWGFR